MAETFDVTVVVRVVAETQAQAVIKLEQQITTLLPINVPSQTNKNQILSFKVEPHKRIGR